MQSAEENVVIYANPERCLSCHSCEVACAVAHADKEDLITAVSDGLQLYPRNHVVMADGVTMPIQCRQCEDAPCTFACPTGACTRADGRVRIVERDCIGCGQCVIMCPFGAIAVHGVAKKCDLCVDWRARNGKAESACAEACPTNAIRFVNLKAYRQAQLEARARELAQSHRHMRIPL